jgi:hypothetical protein
MVVGRQCLAVWMQTTGAALLAVEQHSLSRTRLLAQDGRSAHGLLYSAAVRADGREREHCQDRVDISAPRRAHSLWTTLWLRFPPARRIPLAQKTAAELGEEDFSPESTLPMTMTVLLIGLLVDEKMRS